MKVMVTRMFTHTGPRRGDVFAESTFAKQIALIEAKKNFSIVVERYPNTDFALDSEFKLEFIEVMLASKEMYLGRHYQNRNKWIAAINRFQNVTKNYSHTIFVEEALHRLVEINYKLGLEDESQKYANILGYN